MLFELFLSQRYLRAKRKQAFISVISVISIVGVMVGVMALIIVLSVMNGFRAELMSKILGVRAHIWVSGYAGSLKDYRQVMKDIKSVEGVVDTSPSIFRQAMLTSGNSEVVALRGVDPESINKVIDIGKMITEGNLSSLEETHEGLPAIIVGKELARSLNIGVGDVVTITSPDGRLTPLGRSPRKALFIITGLFESGMSDYDLHLAFVSLREAQKLFGMGDRISQIEVRVDNPDRSDVISKKIKKRLGNQYFVQDWRESNRSLLEALQLEKYTMFVILTMIVVVGALNIISVLVMTVIEKSKDIAILRTMGATKRSIMSVFMVQGLFVGIIGTVAGVCSGLGICYLLSKYKFISIPSDVYLMSTLPVLVDWTDVAAVVMAGMFLSFLTTIYPSWHASRLNPVETLRYE